MKVTRTGSLTALGLAGAMLLSACGSDNGAKATNGQKNVAKGDCAGGSLSGAGSTFQANMESQWAKDFAAKCSGAQVNYQSVGSGAGIEQFGAGTVDFGGSDVVMKPAEQAKADATCGSKAIHIPITAGGIALIYKVKGVDTLNLSAKSIAGIFQGTIKTWNDQAIKADNPDASLPSTAISAFHRSDGSGTTAVFSQFLDAVATGDWKLGSGKELDWPAGQGAKGSEGVTAGVKQTDGSITYAEVSFAKGNSLNTAKVKGSGPDFVEISADSVRKGIEAYQPSGTEPDLGGKIAYTSITEGYPISTVSYAIVCSKPKDTNKAKALKSYFDYVLTSGQQAADGLGFAPLPQQLADKAKASVDSLT